MLRGLWGFFGVIFGGIVLASFGRVPFPGPGIKWRDPLAPAGPGVITYASPGEASSPPLFLLPRKKSASLIFFFLLI